MKSKKWERQQNIERFLGIFPITLFLLIVFVGCEPTDPKPGIWTTGTPAITKRSEVAVVEMGGLMYIIGGFVEHSNGKSNNIEVSKTLEVYDPKNDRWNIQTPLPVALNHLGAGVIENQLYVVGGFSASNLSVWNPVNTLYKYDPRTDTWTELMGMPTARGALGVAVHEGKLYAFGGYDGKENPNPVEVYDPLTNSWSSVTTLPTPRDHLAVVTFNHLIYTIGGRIKFNYRKNLAMVEVYDPKNDQWATVKDMPTPRSGITAGVLHDQIYVVGGESTQKTFSENERYDPQTNVWKTMAPLPTARHGLGSAVIEEKFYVVGGGTKPGLTVSNRNEIFSLPPLELSH